MKNHSTRNIILFVIFVIILYLLTGCKVPQKSTKPVVSLHDTVNVNHIDSFYIEQGSGYIETEKYYRDTLVMPCPPVNPCPPVTVINARKVKRSGNTDNSIKNAYNEINDLKRSVQIRDSQIDSLNIQLGKKCVGAQTNNGAKWYLWFFIGMACGGLSYQLIRTLITKKV